MVENLVAWRVDKKVEMTVAMMVAMDLRKVALMEETTAA